jgi:hypothetical protein
MNRKTRKVGRALQWSTRDAFGGAKFIMPLLQVKQQKGGLGYDAYWTPTMTRRGTPS